MPELTEIKKDSSESFQQNQPPIQQVLIIIEHKIRNLEKRKGKLDGYKEILKSGQELNADQEVALEKYEEVCNSLDLSRDFCKQFQGIANAANKEAKREARRNAYLKQQNEISKVREVLIIQDTLSHLKEESVRLDFLNGTNSAAKIDADDMDLLEKFLIEGTPTRPLRSDQLSFVARAQNAAEVISNVIDGKPKDFGNATFGKVKDVLQTIHDSGYFDKDIVTVEGVVGGDNATVEDALKDGEELDSETVSESDQQVNSPTNCGGNVAADELMRKSVVESIPEMGNHREQTKIQQPLMNNLTSSTTKATDFGNEISSKCAPSAKNVPVPMFKCPPQMIINQQQPQHSIPQQQPVAVPTAIAPSLNLNPGIVQPQVAPAPGVPAPGQLQHIAPVTTVRAVEQAYFKHAQYIQQQPQPQPIRSQQPQQPIHEVIGSANFFFLQESELDSPEIPTPAPGFPAQHIQQQPTSIKQQPNPQPSPALTHNHTINPNNTPLPSLPTVNNIHHNSSPISQQPMSQPPLPHLQHQLQHAGHVSGPGISTQTFTNQTFSSVTPQQQQQPQSQSQKPPQQMFTPPGLGGLNGGINNSATFNSSPSNHKPAVDLNQQSHIGFQAATAVAVAVTPMTPHQQQPKSLQQSVSSLGQQQQQSTNNMLATASMNNNNSTTVSSSSAAIVSGLGGYNSSSTTTSSNIPGFSTNNIQPFSTASQNLMGQQQQLLHQTTSSHYQQAVTVASTVSQPTSHQNSNTSILHLQQQQQQNSHNLQKHGDEQELTEKLKSSLNINDRKPTSQQQQQTQQSQSTQDQHHDTNSNDDVKDWNLMNNSGYGGRRGGGDRYRRSNNYPSNGNGNSNSYGYGNSRQSSDVGNGSGSGTFFRNNDRYQNQNQNGGAYKTDYGRGSGRMSSGGGGTGSGSGGLNNGQNDYRSSRPTSGGGGGGNLRGNSYRGSTRSQAL